ncbi:hypothetical protein V2J09_004306 [Rumex salicifolius]
MESLAPNLSNLWQIVHLISSYKLSSEFHVLSFLIWVMLNPWGWNDWIRILRRSLFLSMICLILEIPTLLLASRKPRSCLPPLSWSLWLCVVDLRSVNGMVPDFGVFGRVDLCSSLLTSICSPSSGHYVDPVLGYGRHGWWNALTLDVLVAFVLCVTNRYIKGELGFSDLKCGWIEISFSNLLDLKKIWENRPYHISHQLLVMKQWYVGFDPYT